MCKILPKEEWENCPNCDNGGAIPRQIIYYKEGDCNSMGYPIPDGYDTEWEQCEWCYTNPNSVFNQEQLLEQKARDSVNELVNDKFA